MRVLVTLGACVGIHCSQEGLQSSIAFLAVAAGLSEAEDWTPRFGSAAEAYSIQRFWGYVTCGDIVCRVSMLTCLVEFSRFWHQINPRLIADLTKFLLHEVFKMKKLANNAILRYTTLLLHFLTSELLHLVIDIASGIPWHESGAVRFFVMQGLGIIFERIVQFSYRAVFPSSHMNPQAVLWIRIVGHV